MHRADRRRRPFLRTNMVFKHRALTVLALAAGLAACGSSEPVPAAEAHAAAPAEEAEFEPGVREVSPGRYEVNLQGHQWDYEPREIRIPVGTEVTFRGTSDDEVHGFIINGTSVRLELEPGRISEVTHTFTEPGEYQFICDWYCGTGHPGMSGKIIVE